MLRTGEGYPRSLNSSSGTSTWGRNHKIKDTQAQGREGGIQIPAAASRLAQDTRIVPDLLYTSTSWVGKQDIFDEKSSVDEFLKKMQKDLVFKIHASKFGHTFRVWAIMDGIPLNALQERLGHSFICTTSIYTGIAVTDTRE